MTSQDAQEPTPQQPAPLPLAAEVSPPAGMAGAAQSPLSGAKQVVERRRQPRFLAHWRVALFSPTDTSINYLGRTDNVCMQGAAVEMEVNLKPKQVFRIYLDIPPAQGDEHEIVEVIGQVRYSILYHTSFQVGLEFTRFEGKSEQVLRRNLESGRFKQLFDI